MRHLLLLILLLACTGAHALIDCDGLSESQCNDLRATEKRNEGIKAEARAKQTDADAEALARCVINKLPATDSDDAADAAYKACLPGHPVSYADAKPRSGSFTDYIFGYGDGASCTAKEAADTRSPRARRMIKAACEYLYGK